MVASHSVKLYGCFRCRGPRFPKKAYTYKSPSRHVLKLAMTTAYFLKKRTTKKPCHRSSFQTARVRRLMRRNHRGELASQTRNAYLPRNSPHCKETSSCQLYGTIKEYREPLTYTFALYHIDAALSIEIRTFVCKFLREILFTCPFLSYLLQDNKREERYGCESILASDFSGILLKYS